MFNCVENKTNRLGIIGVTSFYIIILNLLRNLKKKNKLSYRNSFLVAKVYLRLSNKIHK